MANIYDKVTARNIVISENATGEYELLTRQLAQSNDSVDFNTIKSVSAIEKNGVFYLEKAILQDPESTLGNIILNDLKSKADEIDKQTPFTSDLKEAQLTSFRKDEFLEFALTRKIITRLDIFKSLYEIDTLAQPNQTFDTYINNALFAFEVRTYESNRSTITIFKNGVLLSDEAPFNVCVNFTFFTSNSEALFFLATQKLESYTWQNLGKELRLFYGSF